eukprot:scaffold57781_cov28-Tisochrysis_lutea.AAC.3
MACPARLSPPGRTLRALETRPHSSSSMLALALGPRLLKSGALCACNASGAGMRALASEVC